MVLQTEYHHLIDIVREHTHPSDSRQELAPKIVSALKPRGYFSLLLPKTLGGAQVDYPDYINLVLRFAEVDASTAWCINQGSVLASLARLLDPDTAKMIWPSSEISLANGPPSGTCESIQTDDGCQLTGSWNFSSGITHADWLIGIANTTMKNGDQTPMMHLLPKSAALIHKTWDVVGLRQTGSYEFSTEALLVPKHLTFAYQIKQGEFPLYQIPLNLLFTGGFAAVALGTSRAAIDHAIERCRLKIKRFVKTTMQQDSSTQEIIGHAEAKWQAAKSYLVSRVEEMWLAIVEQGSCP